MPKPNVREQIVVAGLEILHRRGFNGCGVQDITDAAGVPKGSFYNHFESKEALGVAVLDRYWQICGEQLRMLSDEPVPPLDRLRRYFESLAGIIAGQGYTRGCLIGNFSIELADASVSPRFSPRGLRRLKPVSARHSAPTRCDRASTPGRLQPSCSALGRGP
jgi:TetR/AcrR family transcriptional regulator, transcriptional repressor for nem operon